MGLKTLGLNIEGMKCERCVLKIERALKNIEGVETAAVNLEGKSAEIVVKKENISSETFIEAITNLGFKAALEKNEER
ncbi:heavy-metal-associated domain-containing protein [Caldithrix abyssi]|nr:heavy-metal-associated domain-containing protein [Caldithrix abyssi]